MAGRTWQERIELHGNGIDTDHATQSELEDYVATKTYTYETENFTDDTLWGVYQEDFVDFTVEAFQNLRTDTRAKLRVHLLQRGVYVQAHSKNLSIGKTLFNVLQEDTAHQWTDQELAQTADKLDILSKSLRRRLTSEGTITSTVASVQGTVTPSNTPLQPVQGPVTPPNVVLQPVQPSRPVSPAAPASHSPPAAATTSYSPPQTVQLGQTPL
jgi:hypothetical protein